MPDIADLIDADLRLQPISAEEEPSDEEPLTVYRFHMVHSHTGETMGFINLRVGSGENITRYRGHIGYGVDEPYRGHGYAGRACKLLLPLARRCGLDTVWVTCNPDNIASRRTLERIGAELIEVLTVPENTEAYRAGARVKCRYRL